jgi:hypothetical protein
MMLDRHARRTRAPARHAWAPSRTLAWWALAVELLPVLTLPLVTAPHPVTAVIYIGGYFCCGLGWLLLRDWAAGAWIVLVHTFAWTPLVLLTAYILASAGYFGVALALSLIMPVGSALVLALTWFPRTATSEPAPA